MSRGLEDPHVGPDPSLPPSEPSLTHRTLRSLMWMYMSTGGLVVLQMVVVAVLARLVTPHDFGVVAAGLIVVEFARVLSIAGLQVSVVQLPTLSTLHLRTAYGISLVAAAIASAAVFLAAPALAEVFGISELVPVLRILAVVLLIRGLTLGEFLLERDMRFREVATVELVAYTIGYGGVAVGMALRGWGLWAIVGGQIGQVVVSTIAYAIVRPHPLRPAMSLRAFRDLMGIGAGDMLAETIYSVAWYGDNFVVGRWLGAATLGLYDRAYRLMVLPTEFFTRSIRRVLFPAMSSVQDDHRRLGRAYLAGIGVVGLVILPASVLLSFLASDIVRIFLGPDWLDLLPAFHILIFGMFFMAVPSLSDSLLLASGAVYRRASRLAVHAVLVVIAAMVGQRWGLAGVAAGVLAAMVIKYLLLAQISLSIADVRWRAFATAHLPGIVVAAAVGGALSAVLSVLRPAELGPFAYIACGMLTAGVTVVIVLRLAPLLPGFRSLARLVDQMVGWLPAKPRSVAARLLGSRAGEGTTR